MLFIGKFVMHIHSVRQPSSYCRCHLLPQAAAQRSSLVTETCTGGFGSSEAQVYRSRGCSLDTISYITILVVSFYSVPLSAFFIGFFIHLLSMHT